jgi:hypothetical protein
MTDSLPACAFVKSFRIAARDCIEYENRFAGLSRGVIDRSHQASRDASAPCATVNQHLCDVCAVRLVLGQGSDQLHSADDTTILVLRNEEYPPPAYYTFNDLPPEVHRRLPGNRQHEAYGCTALDAVDQQFRQRVYIGNDFIGVKLSYARHSDHRWLRDWLEAA